MSLLAAVALLSASCSTITSVQPIGHPLAADSKIPADLTGIWRNDENEVFFVQCLKDGTIYFAAPEWDEEKKHFKLEISNSVVRTLGEYHVINARMDGAGDSPFHPALFVMRPDSLVMWAGDPEAFLPLVKNEELVGTFEEKEERNGRTVSVKLTGDSAKITERLEVKDPVQFFDLKNPLVLYRINPETKGMSPRGPATLR